MEPQPALPFWGGPATSLAPFALVPVKLAASTTAAGEEFGMPKLTAFDVGWLNFHSWALLAVLCVAVVTGFGRRSG